MIKNQLDNLDIYPIFYGSALMVHDNRRKNEFTWKDRTATRFG